MEESESFVYRQIHSVVFPTPIPPNFRMGMDSQQVRFQSRGGRSKSHSQSGQQLQPPRPPPRLTQPRKGTEPPRPPPRLIQPRKDTEPPRSALRLHQPSPRLRLLQPKKEPEAASPPFYEDDDNKYPHAGMEYYRNRVPEELDNLGDPLSICTRLARYSLNPTDDGNLPYFARYKKGHTVDVLMVIDGEIEEITILRGGLACKTRGGPRTIKYRQAHINCTITPLGDNMIPLIYWRSSRPRRYRQHRDLSHRDRHLNPEGPKVPIQAGKGGKPWVEPKFVTGRESVQDEKEEEDTDRIHWKFGNLMDRRELRRPTFNYFTPVYVRHDTSPTSVHFRIC